MATNLTIQIFEVKAGNMHCGSLLVWPNGRNTFINRSDDLQFNNQGIIAKIASYKNLKLIRRT